MLHRIFPAYLVEALRTVWSGHAQSLLLKNGARKARKLVTESQEILLELGSGDKRGSNGWITLDIYTTCDIYWDLLLPLPFPDNSVTTIYSSHLLEHFSYLGMMKLLAECRRILKPGGRFSVCVPDAGIYIRGYVNDENFIPQDIYEPAYHFNTKIDFVNYAAYMDGHHRHMFDKDNLLTILRKSGFKEVSERKYDSETDDIERDWESIYAVGAK